MHWLLFACLFGFHLENSAHTKCFKAGMIMIPSLYGPMFKVESHSKLFLRKQVHVIVAISYFPVSLVSVLGLYILT